MNTNRRNFPAPQRLHFHEWWEGEAFAVEIKIRPPEESALEALPAPLKPGLYDELATNIVVRLQLNRQHGDESR